MSRGQPQPRTHPGRRTLERCKEKGKPDNVVFIDVDSDNFHCVMTVNPQSLQQTRQGSRSLREDKECPSRNIISINDGRSSENDIPGNVVEGGADLDSDATSSKGSCAASSQSRNSVDDECQIVWERKFPLKLFKCKQTYYGETPSRNRYCLNPVTESSSSESDSDCEFMEDSSGSIREQWEKASLRKKMFERVWSDEDQASASGSHSDTQTYVEVENMTNYHAEATVYSSLSNANGEKESLPIFAETGDDIVGYTSLKPEGDSLFPDLDETFEPESPLRCKIRPWEKLQFPYKKANVQDRGETFPGDPSIGNTECQSDAHVNHVGASFRDKEEQVPQGSSLWSPREQDEIKLNYVGPCFQDKEETVPREPFLYNAQSGHDTHFDHSNANFQDEETSLCYTQHLSETQVGDDKVCCKDKVDPAPGENFFCNVQLRGETEVNHERTSCQEKGKPISEEPSLCNTQQDETQINHGRFKGIKEPVVKSMTDIQLQDERNPLLHAQERDGTPDVQNDIIGEREKLKETDEYKRAAEEEWASRKLQLQIQAEEAQRLRKRRRAQTMRLLDMERRQKHRVAEMRDTQKKDEEIINLKEQLRVEVRNELDKLEVKCHNMASLLRGLGIHVGGGLYPLPHEVHAAYKQALLRFHPDRASRTDIRQHVEAEEKFKLISRVKEKFLSTSWH
ncbi:hypothetical protein HHK36_024417 [Tetracentron sinense]|uniref:J domain-containing protein n=1 Tax=Tetracentron sinense TaxID=13715 RepID=A0A835D7G9_TETSI|nr:hypothetical protein HHK36_024417 [Tetracentron sinense]